MNSFFPFSKKQLSALTWWCQNSPYHTLDAIICDGAVRSGKTLCMSLSFVFWSFSAFEGQSFALCGKTITSLRRNVIAPLIPTLTGLSFSCEEKVSKNYIDISFRGRTNRFYLFSGKDESSASLIQGMTLAGVLFDEVALMPRSFVEQALARCSTAGSRFWFNCNPENPFHWFYLEWIQKRQEKNALYLHFKMEDNPSLSKKILQRYRSLYSGRFYDRFILGKWVSAQGLIYPMFDSAVHVVDTVPLCSQYVISCDYGTLNPSSFGLWGHHEGRWYRVKEYYHDARATGVLHTDEEYYQSLCRLADGFAVTQVTVDPSAASFIETIRRHGKFQVTPAKNDVLTGIRRVSGHLMDQTLLFHSSCTDTIREFHLYRWDEQSTKDVPIKENDHAMDDIRYFAMTLMEDCHTSFVAISANRRL